MDLKRKLQLCNSFIYNFFQTIHVMVQEKQQSNQSNHTNQSNQNNIHRHHSHALFFLFCLAAIVGVAAVLFGHTEGNSITGALSTTATYTSCVDYGNYIILSNDAGWKRVKKDLCTGVQNKLIRKAACVLKNDPTDDDYGEYTFTYTAIASCDSGERCALDENRAAYCPK